jgi:alkylhydroperoxidase family enzyme
LARRLGWTDDQIEHLAEFESRADFTEKEKVALRVAEVVTRNARGLDDRLWQEVRRHFDEGEVVELLAAIGLFNYFNRFNDALRMEPTK